MDPDPGMPESQATGLVRLGKGLRVGIQRQHAIHGPGGMVRNLEGRTEEGVKGIADDLVDGATVLEHDSAKGVQVFVEDRQHDGGFRAFDQGGEPGEVGEHEGEFDPLAAQRELRGVSDQLVNHLRCNEPRKGLPDEALLLALVVRPLLLLQA